MGAKAHIFVVTRQHQWPDGAFVVEIAQGGIDYCNADALSKRYDGEFEEIVGMEAAVKKGIEIYRAWKKDEPKKTILIGDGFTHGFTLPFEGQKLTKKVERELLKKAAEFDEKLPKCAKCGEFLGGKNERYGNEHTTWIGGDESYPFCSQQCAERDWEEQELELAKLNEDD